MIAGVLLAGVLGAVTFSDDLRRTHQRLLRDAIQLSKMTMLRASQEAEIDHAQFRRQVEMLEGSHKRLAMLPPEFWSWYGCLLVQQFGLPPEMRRSARLVLALIGRKRTAKANIAAAADVKRSA